MLTKYLIESAKNNNIDKTEGILDELYITDAIMCARKVNNYRGNNIKLKESTSNCMENIKSQIEIVKPKIILTLEYFPLYSLSSIYDFKTDKNLTLTIKDNVEFNIGDLVIIPLFYPRAQIKKEEQLKQ